MRSKLWVFSVILIMLLLHAAHAVDVQAAKAQELEKLGLVQAVALECANVSGKELAKERKELDRKAAAKTVNKLGLSFHKQKEYVKAMTLFQCATSLDPEFALAHYNLACAIALDVSTTAQESSYTVRDAKAALQKAIQLDPQRKARALEDPDLAWLRGSFFWVVQILGVDPKSEQGREKLANVDPTAAEAISILGYDPQTTEGVRKLIALTTRMNSKNECGGGASVDAIVFRKDTIAAGCGIYFNDNPKPMTHGYVIDGPSIDFTKPTGPVKKLRYIFENGEARIEALDKDGKVVNTWYEFSGYQGGV
jgi:hypothetical protein